MEINKFSFMKMEYGSIFGMDYQNGRMKGYRNAKDYICAQQKGRCKFCEKGIDHYHHILPKSRGGSDLPENLVGLCSSHHALVHKDKKWSAKLAELGKKKTYGAISVLNQAIPYIYIELCKIFGEEHVHVKMGYDTEERREQMGLPKYHTYDAVAIATNTDILSVTGELPEVYEVKQFRRHNRANINAQTERSYKLGKKTVAKNRRKRMDQKTDSLHEYYLKTKQLLGRAEARKHMKTLRVVPSKRSYNNKDRLLPGTVFLHNGKRYIMSGQITEGKYLKALGDSDTNYPIEKVIILSRNTGLVYL